MTNNNDLRVDHSFQAIFEAAVEGILVVDPKGKIIMANQATIDMFGFSRKELVGKSINALVPRKMRQNHQQHMDGFFKKPKARRMGIGRDLMGLRKDGAEFPIEVSLSHTKVDDEPISIAFCIDISERKKAEEALRKSEEQLMVYASELEDKVKQRTEELKMTVDDLEEANKELHEQIGIRQEAEKEIKKSLDKERDLNELKSRFVSMASHEFRTPLSTILSSASLIAKYQAEEMADKRLKHVNRIKSSVGNLTNILDDFLSLGKLEEGKIDVILSKTDIRELISEVIDEMRVILRPGQTIELNVVEEVASMETDSRLLKNALINLTSNASKYSPDDSEIEVEIRPSNGKLRIAITDHGMGIPDEDQKHLFSRFFRASNAINFQGTGLGLNIVRKYVELLNGSISFYSRLEKGTTFTIELPLKQS